MTRCAGGCEDEDLSVWIEMGFIPIRVMTCTWAMVEPLCQIR